MSFHIRSVLKCSSFTIFIFSLLVPGAANAEGRYGFETNIPNYFLNGYHASLWYGDEGQRIRFVTAKAEYPDSLTESGFKDKTLTFIEIEFDFFFGEQANNFRGFWLAGGFGRTRHEITSQSSGATASIKTYDLHFGSGYTFEISRQVTLNPWIGGAYHIDAPDSVTVGDETWQPKQFELVGGIKLGIDF